MLAQRLLVHPLVELLLVGAKGTQLLELLLELSDDQRRAPTKQVFADQHIRENVVADVQDVVGRDAQAGLDQARVPSEVDLTRFELSRVRRVVFTIVDEAKRRRANGG